MEVDKHQDEGGSYSSCSLPIYFTRRNHIFATKDGADGGRGPPYRFLVAEEEEEALLVAFDGLISRSNKCTGMVCSPLDIRKIEALFETI